MLKAVQRLDVDIMTCVRVGMDVSERFPVIVELRQGGGVSPRLFNVYIDVLVRQVNA